MPKGRRRWHRNADSVWRESMSNDVAAFQYRLGGYLNDRWASEGLEAEAACRVELDDAMLIKLAGTQGSGRNARPRGYRVVTEWGRHGSRVVTDGVRDGSRVVVVHWPKYSDFQRYDTWGQGKTPPIQGESEDSPAPAPASKSKSPQERASRKREKKIKTDPPDRLSDEDRDMVTETFHVEHPAIVPKLGALWLECRDWHLANGVKRKLWGRTFCNWVRKAIKFEAENAATPRTDKEKMTERMRTRYEAAEAGTALYKQQEAERGRRKAKANRDDDHSGRRRLREDSNGAGHGGALSARASPVRPGSGGRRPTGGDERIPGLLPDPGQDPGEGEGDQA